MTHYIIDRRQSGRGKSVPNRKKLLDRVRGSVKDAVKDAISTGNIGDVVKGGKRVRVPMRDLNEPQIVHGEGGVTRRTIPGNENYGFNAGDTTPRPRGGEGGQSRGGSPDGEGEDEFTFELTRDEFLEFFFEDLALPDLMKRQLAITNEKKPVRNGFSRDGNPSALDLMQTMKSSMSRRAALRTPKKKKLRELEKQLEALKAVDSFGWGDNDFTDWKAKVAALELEIETLKKKIKQVPYVDELDLKYRTWTMKDQPATQAVMFCLMDVSGSMSQWHKDIAKRFYMLLYLFLHRNYEKIDLVFVRHHTQASEVDEHTFFYDRESGGTIVSSGLELVNKILDERYPRLQWNAYVAQSSDGDTWADDHSRMMDEMTKLLPKLQYFFYIDIARYGESAMWQLYRDQITAPNFAQKQITDVSEIYDVFRQFFEAK